MQIVTDDLLTSQLAWLREILKATQWSPTKLARESGLSPSTLLRPLGGKSHHAFSGRTINKVNRTVGSAAPRLGSEEQQEATREPTDYERLMRARKAADELFAGSNVSEITIVEAQAVIYDILAALARKGAEPTEDVLRAIKETVSAMLRRRDMTAPRYQQD